MKAGWKDIAVVVGPEPASEPAVAMAGRLALTHGAVLTGLRLLPHAPGGPEDGFARGAAVKDVIARRRSADEAIARDRARQFADALRAEGVKTAFRVGWFDGISEEAVLAGLHCDLIVTSRALPTGGAASWTPEGLLFAHGAPLLVAPDAPPGTMGDHVVVAWNGSRESRRAVNDALPFLTRARAVTLLVIDDGGDVAPIAGPPVSEAVRHLACHGVTAEPWLAPSDGEPVARRLEAEALRAGADLLILGAYSHGRATEYIFGGVTHALLARAALPVFFSR